MGKNCEGTVIVFSLRILQYMVQRITDLEKQVKSLERDKLALLQVIEREIDIQENAC